MTAMMNFLDEWRTFIILEKYKRAYTDNSYFKSIDEIYAVLQNFFGEEEFTATTKNQKNWLLHILANNQVNSLFILSEIAELIKYYTILKGNQIFRLKNANGSVNHNELKERLFEIYVNYILKRSGLNPIIGSHYNSADGNKKEIDIELQLAKNYNVEVTKYYDSYSEELLEFSEILQNDILKVINSKTLNREELFSGYLVFKSNKNHIIKRYKNLMRNEVTKYINLIRHPESLFVPLEKASETEDASIKIESIFSENFKHYPSYVDKFPSGVTFRLKNSFDSISIDIDLKIHQKGDITDKNKFLLEKIESKTRQHKDYDGNLLIVIGMEHIFSTHKKRGALPIQQEHVDGDYILKRINKRTAVVLIFKVLQSDRYKSYMTIIADPIEHEELLSYLNDMKYDVVFHDSIIQSGSLQR